MEPDAILSETPEKTYQGIQESSCCNLSCGCAHHAEHNHAHDACCTIASTEAKISDPGKYEYLLEGLDCAQCAAKLEDELKKMPELDRVSVTFMNKTLSFDTDEDLDYTAEKVQKVISRLEPEVKMIRKGSSSSSSLPKQKKDWTLLQIGIGAVFFLLAMFLQGQKTLAFLLFMISYLILGLEILIRAIRNIIKGQVFDENFLMALATVGAILIQEYPEGVAVMLFYQIGEYFQRKAVERTRQSISDLMDIRPDVAFVVREGKIVAVDPQQVQVGERIIVKAGEKIPLDGVVIQGKTALDTSALTGESQPREVEERDSVLSGTINLSGRIEIQVTKPFSNSTVAKILDLVENASAKKAPTETLITRFARVYTPVVVFLAVAIGLVLPWVIPGADFREYLYRALSFLVVSCPCALVISVPLSYFAGIGGLSSQGVLVKGSNYLDVLQQVDTFVFDKTGTLTEGRFAVEKVISDQPKECLRLAAEVERNSNHPISRSILEAVKEPLSEEPFDQLTEIAGRGIKAVRKDQTILVGNLKLMKENGIAAWPVKETGTLIYVACNGVLLGIILSKDQLKAEAKDVIAQLHKEKKRCLLLTGDHRAVGQEVADQLQMDGVYTDLLPQDKVTQMEQILQQKTGKVAFVGDGINDAPVLAISDVGFAMGSLGSDAAIEAADIVLMNDRPSGLLTAVKGAQKIHRIVIENIVFSLFIKIGVLLLIAFGAATMWEAVFADVGVAVLAILNAIRGLKI